MDMSSKNLYLRAGVAMELSLRKHILRSHSDGCVA